MLRTANIADEIVSVLVSFQSRADVVIMSKYLIGVADKEVILAVFGVLQTQNLVMRGKKPEEESSII